MKRIIYILLVISIISCKTEYEQIRISNDPYKIQKAALQYFDDKDYIKAQVLLEQSIPYFRGKKEAEDLYYKFAQVHYELGQYILAAHYYERFGENFFNSEKKEEADYMIGFSYFQLSPNAKLDQSYSLKAIDAFQSFINNYPTSAKVWNANQMIDDIRGKLEQKAYEQGKLYYKQGYFNSAIQSFENLLKDYPETARKEDVLYTILKANFVWAENSIYEKKKERFEDTIDKYQIFKKKYPKSDFLAEAESIKDKSNKEIKILENVRY